MLDNALLKADIQIPEGTKMHELENSVYVF
jgi:hypothetical protein